MNLQILFLRLYSRELHLEETFEEKARGIKVVEVLTASLLKCFNLCLISLLLHRCEPVYVPADPGVFWAI